MTRALLCLSLICIYELRRCKNEDYVVYWMVSSTVKQKVDFSRLEPPHPPPQQQQL